MECISVLISRDVPSPVGSSASSAGTNGLGMKIFDDNSYMCWEVACLSQELADTLRATCAAPADIVKSTIFVSVCVCTCVCVCVFIYIYIYVCVCVKEREEGREIGG